jgi:excisionase family DNA binding protein
MTAAANQNEMMQALNCVDDTQEYLTKEELAKRLKKTVRTIENWQRRGILPFVKAGRSVLFNWVDVKRHLHSNFRVVRRTITK